MTKNHQNTVYLHLSGGLGNQMFQYAMGRAVAHELGAHLALDNSYFDSIDDATVTVRSYELDVFNINSSISTPSELAKLSPSLMFKINRRLNRMASIPFVFKTDTYDEKELHTFDKGVFGVKLPTLFKGYWQHPQYFEEIEQILKKDFSLAIPISEQNEAMSGEIASSESVSIHVRRGDYAINKKTLKTHGLTPLEYYRAAVKLMNEQVENPTYFIFSDDPDWVKKELNLESKAFFVTGNVGKNSCIDMHLMAQCKHNIIANSTFSWWGSWLNSNPDKLVIAPERWYADSNLNSLARKFTPADWKRI